MHNLVGLQTNFTFRLLPKNKKELAAKQEKLNELYMDRLYPLFYRESINMMPDAMKNKMILMVESELMVSGVSAKIPEDLRDMVEVQVGGKFWY